MIDVTGTCTQHNRNSVNDVLCSSLLSPLSTDCGVLLSVYAWTCPLNWQTSGHVPRRCVHIHIPADVWREVTNVFDTHELCWRLQLHKSDLLMKENSQKSQSFTLSTKCSITTESFGPKSDELLDHLAVILGILLFQKLVAEPHSRKSGI